MYIYIYIYIIFYQIVYIYIYTHIYIYEGHTISSQAFFVWAFEINVVSWKYSMLLLDIWDDWPIFMISGSNEQIQKQLGYTLLKPDCQSWWISKMQSGREDPLKERYAIKFCFKFGKNTTEMYGMLQTAFRPSCMNRASVFQWHKRVKEGREYVKDDERCGRSKEVNRPELIGQTVRVRGFYVEVLREFRRDSIGRGPHSSNRVSRISTRTLHQSTTPSLLQTIWPRWAWI